MASIIKDMMKTSVERKKHCGGYRLSLNIGTGNTWMFDLTDSEFEEFLEQVTRAHGPVLGSCVETSEPPNKAAQATVPQPPPTGNGRKSYYDHPTIDDLQAIDVIQDFSYNVATAIAYLWRWGRKPNTDQLEDGRKAIQHIEFECERLKAQRPTPPSAFAGLRGKFGGAFDDF